MIRLNEVAALPQTYTSIEEYLTELQKETSSIVYLLLGSGLASDTIDNVDDTFNISTTPTSVTLTSSYSDKLFSSFAILNDPIYKGMLISGKLNGVSKETIPFDEDLNILNGSLGNPITTGYMRYTEFVSGWSIDKIASVVYVNGTPQPSDNISVISTDDTNRKAQIGFRQIIGGQIYPDPIRPDGSFTSIVLGGYMANFFSELGDPIQLRFSNLDLFRTTKPLILEVYDVDSATRQYFLVSPEFETGKPYYSVAAPGIINVYIPDEIRSVFSPTSTVIYLYFAEIAELQNFGGNNKFYRQYKLPVSGLTPDSSDLKVFAISRSTGEVIELVAESNALIGSYYSLDYKSGILNIYNIGGRIPADVYVAVAGYKYEPPLKPHHVGDYVNSIQLFYSVGGVYNLGSPPEDTLYVYLLPEAEYESLSSFVNAAGKIVTAPRMQKFVQNIYIFPSTLTGSWIVEDSTGFFGNTEVTPIFLGELHRSGSTYTFTPNPTADSPYERLRDLARSMSVIAANSYTTEKIREDETLPSTNVLIIPVDYVHDNATEIQFYGLSGKLYIIYPGGPTEKSWQLELGYYDPDTNVFTPLHTLGTGTSSVSRGYFQITDPTFPDASIWGTTSPTTNVWLAIRVTITDGASGETEYRYDYSLSVYYNIKY